MHPTQKEILDTVTAMPGLTSNEIAELLSHRSRTQILNWVSNMAISGTLLREKDVVKTRVGPRTTYRYTVNPTPGEAPVERCIQVRKRKVTQTDTGLAYELDQARARIRELEEWRAEAIRRFPDLGVAPPVLEARKIVAQLLREGGDLSLADAVMAGRKDTILPMRATITALEAAVD